jgi:hypothetical protein
VIFVVWDDWGGFSDYILPYNVYKNCSNWGCGYTYGFRVPFLVVSAYTPSGYVSGKCGRGTNYTCPNYSSNGVSYQHDFGSILAFIEHNFGLTVGGINPQQPYADAFSPETRAYPLSVPLADFFQGTYRDFESIATTNNSFTTGYFVNYNGPPVDPDNDGIDPQN